jgi:hypothetical protein
MAFSCSTHLLDVRYELMAAAGFGRLVEVW